MVLSESFGRSPRSISTSDASLRVISRTSVMHFKNIQLSVPEIAKTLGVDAIVEGSVMQEGSRIRVHAQLIRGATDEHFWSQTYERNVQDVLALQSDVAEAIAEKVEVSVTSKERTRLVAQRQVSPEAYESNLNGQFVLGRSNSRADDEESIRYFQDAKKRTHRLPNLTSVWEMPTMIWARRPAASTPDEASVGGVIELRKTPDQDADSLTSRRKAKGEHRSATQAPDTERERRVPGAGRCA